MSTKKSIRTIRHVYLHGLAPFILCLAGCSGGGASPGEPTSVGASEHVDYIETPDGMRVGLVKDGQLSQYLQRMSTEYPDKEPLTSHAYGKAGASMSSSPPGTGTESSEQVEKSYCWVILDWCSEPGSGNVVCHSTSPCTWWQFWNACDSLYYDYCG